jgi:uncharacterized phage-like protein YoqJ
MKQLKLKCKEDIEKSAPTSCVFTGHRQLLEDFSVHALMKAVQRLIEQGCKTFYCGMAQGFDLYAAQAVIGLKKIHKDVKLIACIPCDNQEKYYSIAEKKLYVETLKLADEKVLVSPTYYQGCMLVRDRYMVDRADVMIAYLRKENGGTAYTVRYFKKVHPDNEIICL